MSIKSCSVLFILCLSLYACHGFRPTVFEKNSIKKQKNEKISDVPKMKPTLLREGGFPKEENGRDEIHNLKDGKAKMHSANAPTSSQILRASPLGLVSWRVPHPKEHDGQNPSFSVDYSPPKTHPPSHN